MRPRLETISHGTASCTNGSDGQGGLLGERVNPAPVRHQPAGSTSEVHEAYLSGKRHLSFALTRPAHRYAHICLDSHISVSAPRLANALYHAEQTGGYEETIGL